MNRVEQRTADDCMVACLAMMLDKDYEEVKGWFTSSGRLWNNFHGLTFTLLEKGYDVSFADARGIGRWGRIRRLVAIVPANKPDDEGLSLSSTRLSLSGTQAPTRRLRLICQSCLADWWDRRWNALSESRKFEDRLVLARFFCRASQSRPIKRRTACRNFSRYGTFGGTGPSGLPYGSSNPAALSSSVTRPKCAPTLTLNIAR